MSTSFFPSCFLSDKYFFREILELADFNLYPPNIPEEERSCPIFHFMPRFVRELPGKWISQIKMPKMFYMLCRIRQFADIINRVRIQSELFMYLQEHNSGKHSESHYSNSMTYSTHDAINVPPLPYSAYEVINIWNHYYFTRCNKTSFLLFSESASRK